MSATYVQRSGKITRQRALGARLRDFSLKRLTFIFSLCTILFISNPGNSDFLSMKLGSHKFEFLGYQIHISSPSKDSRASNTAKTSKTYKTSKGPKMKHHTNGSRHSTHSNVNRNLYSSANNGRTNYHLFTLSRASGGVDIGVLFTRFQVCSNNGRSPKVCKWISNNLCHGQQMFDLKNKSFTVYRLLLMLKISSFLLQKCYIYNAPLFPTIDFKYVTQNPLSLISSTFHEVNSLRDIFSLNIFVYPAMKLFERTTTKSTSIGYDASSHYYGVSYTVVLILVIGGVSNLLSSFGAGDRVGGMKGSLAACLGFIAAIQPQATVLELFDIKLTAGEALFSTFAVTFGSTLLGVHAITAGEWGAGNIFAWAVGGVLGYILGEYRLHPWLITFMNLL